MALFKQLDEFTEFFVLGDSSAVYGIAYYPAKNLSYYGNGIAWRLDAMTVYGPAWVSECRYHTAGVFRNRVIKIKNIKLFPKAG